MKNEQRRHSDLFTIMSMALIALNAIFSNTDAQEPEQVLEWNIKAEKNAYYPGESVLLTLHITNKGSQDEKIFFGADGLEAFSMKIYDSNRTIVCTRGKIHREGLGRRGSLPIPVDETAEKLIVLNQWCSTLLPAGTYHVECNVDYLLFSELQKQPDSRLLNAGPHHQVNLELNIQIVEMNKTKFEEILKTLSGFETQKKTQTKTEWLAEREVAREMIAFTESDLAVPYQLHLLSIDQFTWRKRDIINALVRSGTSQAAGGLAQLYEDNSAHYEDVKNNIIDAVYQLREMGKPEILAATEDFVKKYKRPPTQLKPMN